MVTVTVVALMTKIGIVRGLAKELPTIFLSGHSAAMMLQANLILRAELLELFTGEVIFIYKLFFYIKMVYY